VFRRQTRLESVKINSFDRSFEKAYSSTLNGLESPGGH